MLCANAPARIRMTVTKVGEESSNRWGEPLNNPGNRIQKTMRRIASLINAPEELNMGSHERSSWFIFEIKLVPQMRFDHVKNAHGTQYENCNQRCRFGVLRL